MSGLTGEQLRVAKTIKLFIGGEFVRTESGRSFAVHGHDSKSVYAHLSLASRKDFRNAMTAATGAFGAWQSKTAYNRGQILYRMAEMTEGKREEFIQTLRETLGYTQAKADKAVSDAIDAFVYYAGWSDKYQQVIGSVNPVSGPHHNFTSAEPVGTVGLIANQNFDLGALVAQIAAIVVSGNSLVVLMGEAGSAVLAPLSEVFATSDLPKGVINLLSGNHDELYKHFGTHMELQSLSYQNENKKVAAELKEMSANNMRRMVVPAQFASGAGAAAGNLALENLLGFVEYKTVWHPIGN